MDKTPRGTVRVDDLQTGDARCFPFLDDLGLKDEAFVLRLGDDLFVYVNRCPHWRGQLDNGDKNLFDRSTSSILCQRHRSRFDPRTGEAISGVAEGRLERLPFRREGDVIVVDLPDLEWLDE